MIEALKTYIRPTLTDINNITFSQALEAGLTHCDWLDGRRIDRCGREVVHASHSVAPAKAEELTTNATYGPLFGGSSQDVNLQLCLESRLRRRMGEIGCPEYEVIWKRWDMRLGEPICALVAVARRTSGSGFTGWRTPDHNQRGGAYTDPEKVAKRIEGGHQVNLEDQAVLAGWSSPTPSDMKRKKLFRGDTNLALSGQADMVTSGPTSTSPGASTPSGLTGWSTPNTMGGGQISRGGNRKNELLLQGEAKSVAELQGWNTPIVNDAEKRGVPKVGAGLAGQVHNAASSQPSRGALSPEHSRWLQGYPPIWSYCGLVALTRRQSRKT